MKRFDKGYIYSALLSDFFLALWITLVVIANTTSDTETPVENFGSFPILYITTFVVIYLCLIAYRILYYKTSGYELTENEIKCNRGVLFKKNSVLEYKKIHAINKKQTLIHRFFGIAVLTVDSGSTNTAHQAEITIVEKSKTVDELISELNLIKETGIRTKENTPIKEELLLSENDSLYRFTSKKKILYTLINIATTLFSIIASGVLIISVLGICLLILRQSFLGILGEVLIIAFFIMIAAALMCSVVALIASLINSFIGYYDFKITKRGKDIEISYGLLEKHTNTFSYDRIKAVKITQGIVQRIFGFATIKLEVIGYMVDSGNDNNKNANLGVLVPFCKYDEINEILSKVLPDYVPDAKQTKAISFFPFVSWFALILGIVTGVILALVIGNMLILKSVFELTATLIVSVSMAIVALAVLILLIKIADAILSYQNNGIAINNRKITAYSGGFVKNVTVFMTKNLIAAENVTTPLRKKAGITSLVMHLKTNAFSNVIEVRIQKDELSEELEKILKL